MKSEEVDEVIVVDLLQSRSMALSVGLIGLPNVGKSTLFNALLRRQQAHMASHPFTTISPNKGVVDIPDENLGKLTRIVERDFGTTPDIKPAKLTVVDIAGLVKGAHEGEGLGNEFLGHIRDVDAIIHVIRCFEDKNAPHPLGNIDIQRDREIVETELMLSDIDILERQLSQEKDLQRREVLRKLLDYVAGGKRLISIELTDKERQILGMVSTLTNKPILYAVNINETMVRKPIEQIDSAPTISICAKIEMELAELSLYEQKEYRKSFGIDQSVLDSVLKAAYKMLDLVTFYTIAGGKEISAWSLRAGTIVEKAAGYIHEQMEKGFIKAEVISVVNLISINSWEKAENQGKIRLVGKDYIVSDRDVIKVRFSQ